MSTQPPTDPSISTKDLLQKPYRQVAAYNIDRLSEINRQLPKLLTWFATALTQLTNNPIPDTDASGQPDTLAARQATFRKYALYVGHITEEIRMELTKQINELERHKVIPKRHVKYGAVGKADKGEKEGGEKDKGVRNGGYGEFDVGVLNARASGGMVGGEEVLERVQAVLEELRRRVEEGGGEEMVIDG